MKLLLIRFSSIGDIVLTTPVIRCLKKQLPDAEIHFLVKPQFKAVVQHNPYIDKIHLLQDWDGMIAELKKEAFDEIIDLHHNLRTLRVKKALGTPARSFNKLNIEKFIFVKLKWNVMPKGVHIVDRYMQTVAHLGVVNDGAGLDYFIPKQAEVQPGDIPASHSLGYTAIVIGASFYTKKLPVYKLQELCRKINHPVMLLGGPGDREEGEAISSIDPIKIYNACGKFSLDESADLLRKARLVIAHDTGLMHMAAALKKPVIAVWGSTTPSFGMVPYYGDAYLARHAKPYQDVQVHKLWCRPCTKIGRDSCPQGHFKCMNNINLDEIAKGPLASAGAVK